MGILYILRENTNDKVIFRMCSDELAGDTKGSTCRCIFARRKRIRREADGKKEKKENRFMAVIFVVNRGCSVRYMERSYAK